MSNQHPTLEDPELGVLVRAESTLDDGSTVTHDWFAGTVATGDAEIEIVIDGADTAEVDKLIPRARAIVTDLARARRVASDAIITRFSDSEPAPHELAEGFDDLVLDTIEITADATVLHFTDSCGEHFPEGFWPAVHLDAAGDVTDVSVES